MVDQVSPDEQPIVVSPTAAGEMAVTGLRQLVLIFGGATTIYGLLKGHDVAGVGAYIASSDFALFVGAVATVFTVIYGQMRVLWNKRIAVTTAAAAPDSVAIVGRKPSLWQRFKAFYQRNLRP